MAAEGSSEAPDGRLGPGTLVLVVGPSGAGKDSVIAGVRAGLEESGEMGVVFPARIITRGEHAAEAHRPVSRAEFETGVASGSFALSWQAHGAAYGIPREIDDEIAAGRTVVINASRAAVAEARCRYARVRVVLVDAAYDVRAERLAARGRETRAEIEARLARAVAFDAGEADIVVDNGGDLARSVGQLRTWLEEQGIAVSRATAGRP